ncbi:MAG TPA: hypothetical protein VF368_05470 [Gemmatimonadaceae bacterium]
MLAAVALCALAGTARAQRASLAVGAALPVGDLSNSAGNGVDVVLQARTEPIIGPLPLRIDISYDFLSGKGALSSTAISGQSVSLMGDVGSMFYWAVGPGYYQSTVKTQISGHNVTEQRTYLGAQAALGVNIPVFRWEGFLELSAAKLFAPGPTIMYVPLRFGMRL